MGRKNVTVSISDGSELGQQWDEFVERYDTQSEAGREALRAGIDALTEDRAEITALSLLEGLASTSILSFALALQALALIMWGIALSIEAGTAATLALVGSGVASTFLAGFVVTLFIVARLLLAPSPAEMLGLDWLASGSSADEVGEAEA
jgi:hypothetical protein